MCLLIQAPDSLKLSAGLTDWICGHGPAPLPELASWPSPLPTTPSPRLDDVSAPSACTNETAPASLPNGLLPPILTRDIRRPYQTAPTTELTPSHTSHTSSFEDFAINLVRPRPPRVALLLSFHASKPTSTSILSFHRDLGMKFGCH